IAIGLVWNACLAASGAVFPLDKLLPSVLPYFGVGMLAAVLLDGHSVVDRRRLMFAGVGAVLVDVALHSGAVPGPAGNLAVATVSWLAVERPIVRWAQRAAAARSAGGTRPRLALASGRT